MYIKNILICGLCLYVLYSEAQNNCACPKYNEILNKYNGDSVQAVQLWKEKNFICKAIGYEKYARHLNDNIELDSVPIYLQKAYDIYDKTLCGDSIYLQAHKNMAQYYYTKADYKQCQEYTLKLMKSAEHSRNVYEQATCNTMIAQIFNQTNQAEKGIVYTRKAAAFLSKIHNVDDRLSLLFKLTKRYLWHYQDTKAKGSLDSSKIYSIQELKLAKAQKNNVYITHAYNNLQGIEYELGNYAKALIYLDSAYIYLDKNHSVDLATHCYDKADLLIESNKFKEAENYADSTIYYYSINKNPVYIAQGYELKERILALQGNYKSAYEYKKRAVELLDSIKTVEQTAAVTLLEKKYNQVKNEEQIKELAAQKRIYLLLTLAALLATTSIGFYLRQQQLKHKKDILETEQRLNRARMNPHFFFNALSTLQKFALRDNDGKAIASNLSKFSHIMRETLESTYKAYVTVEQEMEFLNGYLEVQKIRFPKTFSYSIDADPQLEIEDVLIPSMILQPFIENSIEHGFVGIEYAGKISIHFGLNNNELSISIHDNGKGLPITNNANYHHISRASQIIKDRIYLLNIKLKTKAGFTIDNIDNANGVLVKIHLPLLYQSKQK